MRTARPQCVYLRRFVGGVIIHDNMHVRPLCHLPVDQSEQAGEPGCPMPFAAFSDYAACVDIRCSEKQGRAKADRSIGGVALPRTETPTAPDPGFLVCPQHDRPVLRWQTQPCNVLNLISKQRVGRQPERVGLIGLQAIGISYPSDRDVRQLRFSRHLTDQPVHSPLRNRVQGAFKTFGPQRIRNRARTDLAIYIASPLIRSCTKGRSHFPTLCS